MSELVDKDPDFEPNNIEPTENEDKVHQWDDLDISSQLLRGIYSYGFETPSEIQKKAIAPILKGRDIIAQAQSGSGKTGCFSISALNMVDVSQKAVQAVIIVPTHELANQIYRVITSIGSFVEELKVKTIIGGTSIQKDAADMKKNVPHIVVGCAGRIYDMMMRKHLSLSALKLVVLDEADEMLSKGFKDQIYNIFQHLPETVQVALFSATLPPEILRLTDKFMNNPYKIIVKREELSVAGIKQYFVALNDDRTKYDALKSMFSVISVSQCIIYCNSVKKVVDLYAAMTDDGFSVCYIHGSMAKADRDAAFRSFLDGNYRVLISSDVTSRGIDIQQVQFVINFDICKDLSTFLHRVGRTSRYGRKGVAINFITRGDVVIMKKIETHYKINIEELPRDYKGL